MRKKTHEEFIAEMSIINPNIEILSIYINNRTKVLCRCRIDGYEWYAAPANLLKGQGCKKCSDNSKRKTHATFIKEMIIINPNIEILSEYVNNRTKVKCRCKICGHEWEATPSHLLNNRGCPKCSYAIRGLNHRKTHEQFVLEMELLNPNIEILGTYVDSYTEILVKCKKCGNQWYMTPSSLLAGNGCRACYIENLKLRCTKTHEQFICELSLINPNIEVLEKYINSQTKILCRCKIDGYEWYVTPNDLLQGHGCPKCSGVAKKTHEEFIKEMAIINPDIEILTEFVNCRTKILCRCKICGHEWWVIPSDILRGIGCPECKASKGERAIRLFLETHSIEYIPQHKYDDLFGVGGGLLSYDFYLSNYNILIEYQGRQHYEPVDMFGGEEQFVIQQEHDKRKRDYAKSHSINLLEIPYWDFENIETILESYLLKQQVASLIA